MGPIGHVAVVELDARDPGQLRAEVAEPVVARGQRLRRRVVVHVDFGAGDRIDHAHGIQVAVVGHEREDAVGVAGVGRDGHRVELAEHVRHGGDALAIRRREGIEIEDRDVVVLVGQRGRRGAGADVQVVHDGQLAVWRQSETSLEWLGRDARERPGRFEHRHLVGAVARQVEALRSCEPRGRLHVERRAAQPALAGVRIGHDDRVHARGRVGRELDRERRRTRRGDRALRPGPGQPHDRPLAEVGGAEGHLERRAVDRRRPRGHRDLRRRGGSAGRHVGSDGQTAARVEGRVVDDDDRQRRPAQDGRRVHRAELLRHAERDEQRVPIVGHGEAVGREAGAERAHDPMGREIDDADPVRLGDDVGHRPARRDGDQTGSSASGRNRRDAVAAIAVQVHWCVRGRVNDVGPERRDHIRLVARTEGDAARRRARKGDRRDHAVGGHLDHRHGS